MAVFRPSDFEHKGPWIVVTRDSFTFRFQLRSKDEAKYLLVHLRGMAKHVGLEVGYEDVRWACKIAGYSLPQSV